MKFPAFRGLAVAALVLAAAPARAQETPTADQLVTRYLAAIGGPQAVQRYSSMRVTGTVSIPAAGLTGTTDVSMAKPGKMLMTMQFPGLGEIRNGFDGTVGWGISPMTGPTVSDGAELEQVRENANWPEMLTQLSEKTAYSTIETVGRAEYGGRPCWKVRLVRTSGRESFLCFDVENGLIVATQRKQASRMGEIEATTLVSDYRDFGGLKMATKSTTQMAGQEMVFTTTAVEFDTVPATAFDLPADIRTMVGNRQ
ncbi:MAG TPA: hypothetical protein VFQ39_07310 [Longimicrobium sp.]|nr:hypothetical protein [Longimicrobium sp.]